MCLLVLFSGPMSPGTAAPDPVGLAAAVAEVRAALEDMANALNGAPRRVQTTIGTDLHLMSQAIARALDRLENEGAPVADPTLVYDLNLLADIAHAARDELHAIDTDSAATVDPERARRVDRLTEAAAGRLAEVNLVIDSWDERSRNELIDVRDDGGVLVIRSTDRRIYDGIRYVSIALLLIGLLALGLHLLPTRQERPERRPWVPKGPLHSRVGAAVLVLFFASCIGLSLRPGILAALSAEVRVQAQEHPCERLAAQRDRLIVAQQADDPGLIEATKQRMRPAARDCLGLPSDTVTAEAIERLAAKTALARNEPAAPRRPAVGLAAAGPSRSEAAAGPPPEVAELRPAERQASGGLGELLANLRGVATPAGEPSKPADGPGPGAPPTESAAPPTEQVGPDIASRPSPSAGPASEPVPPAVAPIEPAAGPDPTTTRETPAEPGPSPQPPELKPVVFVTTTALNYRDGPSVDARRLGTLVPGARLQVVARDAGWAEVRLNDGRQAYVASEFLEPAP
jgi:hypothetical protein